VPTFEVLPSFWNDYSSLTEAQKDAFWRAIRDLIDDIQHGRRPRHSLRPKRVRGLEGVWEITWANDGRAIFEYGHPVREGEAHVIWRRVGTHDILRAP
jgi:hypothetical protein